MIQNPKMEGTKVWDCRPQVGLCPNNCNQCFYNRPGAFYCDINEPYLPDPDEVGEDIVRMNSGHDSNIQRELVIETAKKYKNYFFNTSIPNFDFPGPVVFTANPKEEKSVITPFQHYKNNNLDFSHNEIIWQRVEKFLPKNLMFVRLRVSPTNLVLIEKAVKEWTDFKIPVVLTFMAYYDCAPPGCGREASEYPTPVYEWFNPDTKNHISAYVWQKRHINSYWCPTTEYKEYMLKKMKAIGGRLVTICGTTTSNYCRDCHNCESYYWFTKRHCKGN